jgi:RND family efflux transporter MFP subunit
LERLQALENQMALTGPQTEQLLAQRDLAKVLHQEAKLDLERSGLTAPFDGWVLENAVEEGQHVNIGQNLGRIYSAGQLDIEVRIPVKDFKWFPAALDQDEIAEADVIFENTGAQRTWKGRVSRIKAQMDDRTRTLPVVVEVDEASIAQQNQSSLRLRPGMFVSVRIKGKEVEQAFVLPRHVVYPGDLVYTVKDDRLKIKSVNILRTYKESVIVNEGLSEGEQIIKTPLSAATDGMMVRVKPEDR